MEVERTQSESEDTSLIVPGDSRNIHEKQKDILLPEPKEKPHKQKIELAYEAQSFSDVFLKGRVDGLPSVELTPSSKIKRKSFSVDSNILWFISLGINEKSAKMLTIKGIEIAFPYEPYDQQKDFMESVINCIDNRSHGLLESPTGTGKTVSLLASSLAWLKNQQELGLHKDTKIFYASRTHSQLKQLISELRSTVYRPVVSILGSRDQMCVNDKLKGCSGSEKNTKCGTLVTTGECDYYNTTKSKQKQIVKVYSEKILDIEDLVKEGRKESFCPFYMSRAMVSESNLIFLPYNYLTNPRYRNIVAKHLEDAIIIFDEGHNLSSYCQEGSSLSLSLNDLQKVSDDYKTIRRVFELRTGITEFTKTFEERFSFVYKSAEYLGYTISI